MRSTGTTPRTLLVSSTPSSGRRSATRAHASTTGMPAPVASSSTLARSTPGRMSPSAGGVTRPPPRTTNTLDVAPSKIRPSPSTRRASSTPAARAARCAKYDCITVIALYWALTRTPRYEMTRRGRAGKSRLSVCTSRLGAPSGGPAVTSSRHELSPPPLASLSRQICSASSGLSMSLWSPSAAMPCTRRARCSSKKTGTPSASLIVS